MTLSVVIVEDDDLIRAHLADLINASNRCALVGSARNGAEAIALIEQDLADVYLVDLCLPDADGVDLIALIKSSCTDARSMVLSTFGDAKHMNRSIRAGALGYLLKDQPDASLIDKIVALHNGESPVTPSLIKVLFNNTIAQDHNKASDKRFERFSLGPREIEVLHLLIDGLPIFNIGDRLCISSHTVNQHLRSIYRKLDVHSSAMAVSTAIQYGFLET